MMHYSTKVPLHFGNSFHYVGYKHIVRGYKDLDKDGGVMVATAEEAAIMPFPADEAAKEKEYLQDRWGCVILTYHFDDDDLNTVYIGFRWKL